MKAIKGTGIYAITNTVNGKTYIGSTQRGFNHRWNTHLSVLRRGLSDSKHLQSAWNKYGEAAFQFSIVEVVDDASVILEREQYWIDVWRARQQSYNLADAAGPDGKKTASAALRAAGGVSKVKTYRVPLLAPDGTRYEEITNLRAFCQEHGLHEPTMRRLIMKQALNNHRGWRRADEEQTTREQAISRAMKKRLQDPGLRAKVGATAKAKMDDPDFKAHCTAALRTPEAMERARIAAIRNTYRFIAPDGTEHTVTDLRSFCQEHGLSLSSMAALHRINTNLKSCKGWKKAT